MKCIVKAEESDKNHAITMDFNLIFHQDFLHIYIYSAIHTLKNALNFFLFFLCLCNIFTIVHRT
jgi:hypothetical protein